MNQEREIGMKKLVFLAIAAMNMSVCGREESGYGEKLKKKTHRLIAEIKSAGKDICSFVSSKKDSLKNEKKESMALAYNAAKKADSVIIESCDHCKNLCTEGQLD
jgi:hypothetical protein